MTNWRPRFTLRAVTITVLVAGLACGLWSIGHRHYTQQWVAEREIEAAARHENLNSRPTVTPSNPWPSYGIMGCSVEKNPFTIICWLYPDEDVGLLRSAVVSGVQPVDAFIENVAHFPFLTQIFLVNSTLTDEQTEKLRRLQALESLRIGSSRLTGAGFKELAHLQKLERLVIDSPCLTPDGVVQISRLPMLKELTLRTTPSSRIFADPSFFRNARLLNTVILAGDVDDSVVNVLATLPELGSVIINPANPTRITDNAVAELTKATRLRGLEMGGEITDKALPSFIACKSLRVLILNNCKITPAGRTQLLAARPSMKITFKDD